MRVFAVILLSAVVASGFALGCKKKMEERLLEEAGTALPCDCEEPCPECVEGKGAVPCEKGEEPGPGDDV
jgi:hypothetical protein